MVDDIDVEVIPFIDLAEGSYKVEIQRKDQKVVKYDLQWTGCRETRQELTNVPNLDWLQNLENLIVLDSIHSGLGRNADNDFYNLIIKPIFKKLSIKHRYVESESSKFISEFAGQNLNLDKSYTILFLSGDTSISEFLNGLSNSDATSTKKVVLLPIPLGTGNAFSSSLGYLSPLAAFSSFLRHAAKEANFPLYQVTFPNKTTMIFFIILSFGFHANLLHACDSPEYKKLGVERFRMASENILKNYDLDLQVQANKTSKNYSYFAIINTPKLEPTYLPSPASNPLKSELHILGYTTENSRPELVELIMQGYKNELNDKLPNNDKITYEIMNMTDCHSNITLNLSNDSTPNYKYQVCCDGTLIDLSTAKKKDGLYTFKIEILPQQFTHKIMVLTPISESGKN